MEGSFNLKKLISNIGFYTKIKIDVEILDDGHGISILDTDYPEWRNSLKFGADYFFERYSKVKKCRLLVSVIELHTMPFDSSSVVVAFAIIQALCDALHYTIDNFGIDEEGVLRFPK